MEHCTVGSLWSLLRAGCFHIPQRTSLNASSCTSGSNTQQRQHQLTHSRSDDLQRRSSRAGSDASHGWDAWACLETLKEVASALLYLHQHGIVHGDIKVRGWVGESVGAAECVPAPARHRARDVKVRAPAHPPNRSLVKGCRGGTHVAI
jgi:hypothetical protein